MKAHHPGCTVIMHKYQHEIFCDEHFCAPSRVQEALFTVPIAANEILAMNEAAYSLPAAMTYPQNRTICKVMI